MTRCCQSYPNLVDGAGSCLSATTYSLRVNRHSAVAQSVTSAPENLRQEQSSRIRAYLITMGIRTACFILAVVLTGWMRWTAVAGAVILPYVAVVFANAVRPRAAGTVQAVTPVMPVLDHEAQTLDGHLVDPPDERAL